MQKCRRCVVDVVAAVEFVVGLTTAAAAAAAVVLAVRVDRVLYGEFIITIVILMEI